jgi:hypothetical protein
MRTEWRTPEQHKQPGQGGNAGIRTITATATNPQGNKADTLT